MAKVLSERIGNQTKVWTINSLLTRSTSQDNTNSGVDNPAFYDSESGLCSSKEDAYQRKQHTGHEGSYTKRQCNGRLLLLLAAIAVLLLVLLSMVTAVIYLAVGEVRTTWQEGSDFQEIEEGISLVEGHLRITNRVFTKDLLSPHNQAYRRLSTQITQSMDAVFLHSLQHYNETRVLSYREGSVVVRCQIHLSKPRLDATHQVGMAVIQALERHHGYLPGGLLQVDIRSLHFTGLPDSNEMVPIEESELPALSVPSSISMSSTTEANEMTDCKGDCEAGQVCLFLPQTAFSRCLVPRDHKDPTGCGGWCVSEHQLCKRLGNATFQCTDNIASCKQGEWRCDNGLCIPAKGRCNGRIDCYDMSDEIDCECGEGKFLCGNNTPCLPLSLKCNGWVDCWDASDEINCTKHEPCGDKKFTCNDGSCVEAALFCDRYPDCGDGSDEPEGCSESCLQTQKQCRNARCVSLSAWCNGVDDCKDGSDEVACDPSTTTSDPRTTTIST